MPVSLGDFSFAECFSSYCEDLIPKEMKELLWFEFPDEMKNVFDELYGSGSRVGGYPEFTQEDPREGNIPDSAVLLLQIDSDGDENDDWVIMWGDSGIANFFIDPEDLKRKDFSKVCYNWDCC